MKFITGLVTSLIVLSVVSGNLNAQEADYRHPFLENRFTASIGAFVQEKKLKIAVAGQQVIVDDIIDFGDQWNFDASETDIAGEFKWRFGKKWSLSAQYFDTSDNGRATLDEDIQWQDYTLKAGTNVGAGIDTTVARVFFGRKFSESPNHEFGLGFGFHWMEIGAFVDGELFLDDQSTGVRKESVSAAAPLPNLGTWYHYAITDKWLATARVDWLDVSFQEYSGNLTNSSLSVSYVPWKNFGVTLAYQYFALDVDVDKDTWKGGVDISYRGPFISVTTTW
jgi:hypothetical protein